MAGAEPASVERQDRVRKGVPLGAEARVYSNLWLVFSFGEVVGLAYFIGLAGKGSGRG
jgi:hypothetical protein